MWDEFKDFPMRKDYVEPDDYEYEPTPHDDVLEKAQAALSRRRETREPALLIESRLRDRLRASRA